MESKKWFSVSRVPVAALIFAAGSLLSQTATAQTDAQGGCEDLKKQIAAWQTVLTSQALSLGSNVSQLRDSDLEWELRNKEFKRAMQSTFFSEADRGEWLDRLNRLAQQRTDLKKIVEENAAWLKATQEKLDGLVKTLGDCGAKPPDQAAKPAPPNCKDSEEHVPVAEARDQIKRYIAQIEERKTRMTDTYSDGAVNTLKAAFTAKGVTTSMSDAEPWAKGGLSASWSESAKPFYEYHLDALTESLSIIEKRGYATKGELATLAAGVSTFTNSERNLASNFQNLVDAYTAKAKIYDQKAAYMKAYDAYRGRLEKKQPYPSNELDKLAAGMEDAVKDYALQIKTIEVNGERIAKESIQKQSEYKRFKVVTKVPGC